MYGLKGIDTLKINQDLIWNLSRYPRQRDSALRWVQGTRPLPGLLQPPLSR